MALEVRLGDEARLTKDLDLGLRDQVASSADLHDRLIDALMVDSDGDGFIFTTGPPAELLEDTAGHITWRVKVAAALAAKPFGAIQLDVSPRIHELDATDQVALPHSLAFAGIPTATAEIIDVHRHAAEKFHAMLRSHGERENSRVGTCVLFGHPSVQNERRCEGGSRTCVLLRHPSGEKERRSRRERPGGRPAARPSARVAWAEAAHNVRP